MVRSPLACLPFICLTFVHLLFVRSPFILLPCSFAVHSFAVNLCFVRSFTVHSFTVRSLAVCSSFAVCLCSFAILSPFVCLCLLFVLVRFAARVCCSCSFLEQCGLSVWVALLFAPKRENCFAIFISVCNFHISLQFSLFGVWFLRGRLQFSYGFAIFNEFAIFISVCNSHVMTPRLLTYTASYGFPCNYELELITQRQPFSVEETKKN